jgi:hypothetical protein
MAKKIKGQKAIKTENGNVVVFIPRGENNNHLIICISPQGDYRPWKCEKEDASKMNQGHWSFMMLKNSAGLRSASATEVELAEKAEIIRERFLKLSYNNRINWDGFRPVPKKSEKAVKPANQKISDKPISNKKLASLKERMKRDELIAK